MLYADEAVVPARADRQFNVYGGAVLLRSDQPGNGTYKMRHPILPHT
jgi:hypothetical protein